MVAAEGVLASLWVAPRTNALTGGTGQGALVLDGADEVIRTPGLLITNQLLYQLSYVGSCFALGRGANVYSASRPCVNPRLRRP